MTDGKGCTATDSTVIYVRGRNPFFVPNAFSPNGDGHNDEWEIFCRYVKTFSLKVFNRWGEMVFSTEDPQAGWNGRYRGEAQPAGVYTYTFSLVFENNEVQQGTGSFTLLR
ncbi:MAG: gliding motility-associated C-terminal domain-containing protein [Chitinophagales bacterium]